MAAARVKAIGREIRSALASTPLGLAAWAIWAAAVLWVACFDPFDLDSRAEAAAESTIQRLLASQYPARAGANIALVEGQLSDRDDNRLNLSLPLSPAVQAQLVDALVAAGVRAIFIDSEYRNPPNASSEEGEDLFAALEPGGAASPTGHKELVEALRAARAAGIPVLIGPVGEHKQLTELAASAERTEVSWDAEHPADYPLRNESGITAAGDLYRIACSGPAPMAGCSKRLVEDIAKSRAPPIALRFGANYPPEQWRFAGEDEAKACRSRSLTATLRMELRGKRREKPCTNHLVVPVSAILLAQNQFPVLAKMLRGRIVLIGSGPGVGDDHTVPGVGTVPGVAIHATALDNLLTWGTRYPRWPADFGEDWQFGPDELLKLAVLLLLPVGLTLAAKRLQTRDLSPKALALRTMMLSGFVVASLLGIAVAAMWIANWPASVALMLAGLSVVVTHLLSGQAFHSAVNAFTGRTGAFALLGFAAALAMLVIAPTLLLLILILLAVAASAAAAWRLRARFLPVASVETTDTSTEVSQ